MAVPKILQLYMTGSQILGDYVTRPRCALGETVLQEDPRPPSERGVDPREQKPGRLLGVSVSGRRERPYHPRESGNEFLIGPGAY